MIPSFFLREDWNRVGFVQSSNAEHSIACVYFVGFAKTTHKMKKAPTKTAAQIVGRRQNCEKPLLTGSLDRQCGGDFAAAPDADMSTVKGKLVKVLPAAGSRGVSTRASAGKGTKRGGGGDAASPSSGAGLGVDNTVNRGPVKRVRRASASELPTVDGVVKPKPPAVRCTPM